MFIILTTILTKVLARCPLLQHLSEKFISPSPFPPAWWFACCYLTQYWSSAHEHLWFLSKFSALSSAGICGPSCYANAGHLVVWVYHEWHVCLYARWVHKTFPLELFFTKHSINTCCLLQRWSPDMYVGAILISSFPGLC